ncbi:MAG: hypothetical protein ACKPKO_17270, partial [Candidatus Fonsibacter sp.]
MCAGDFRPDIPLHQNEQVDTDPERGCRGARVALINSRPVWKRIATRKRVKEMFRNFDMSDNGSNGGPPPPPGGSTPGGSPPPPGGGPGPSQQPPPGGGYPPGGGPPGDDDDDDQRPPPGGYP